MHIRLPGLDRLSWALGGLHRARAPCPPLCSEEHFRIAGEMPSLSLFSVRTDPPPHVVQQPVFTLRREEIRRS